MTESNQRVSPVSFSKLGKSKSEGRGALGPAQVPPARRHRPAAVPVRNERRERLGRVLGRCAVSIVQGERLEVSVSFDEKRDYVA
jgi:hypothetical protein